MLNAIDMYCPGALQSSGSLLLGAYKYFQIPISNHSNVQLPQSELLKIQFFKHVRLLECVFYLDPS